MKSLANRRAMCAVLAGAVGLGGVVVTLGPAVAQAPPPSEPPREAIHCARPFQAPIKATLNRPDALTATLDVAAGRANLAISAAPEEATCFIVVRTPSGTNPVVFEWNVAGVVAKQTVDPIPFQYAGRYCYQVYFGDPEGLSQPSNERCLDVPTSIAPAPEPTPTLASIRPPNAGSGAARNDLNQPHGAGGWWLLPIGLAASGMLGVAGVLARRIRS
jgi:hypothetical protein